jgi:hypothetical protein
MTFTVEGLGEGVIPVIEINEGSYVYLSEDTRYLRWADLSEDQKAKFLKVQDLLEKAFTEATGIIASMGIEPKEDGDDAWACEGR